MQTSRSRDRARAGRMSVRGGDSHQAAPRRNARAGGPGGRSPPACPYVFAPGITRAGPRTEVSAGEGRAESTYRALQHVEECPGRKSLLRVEGLSTWNDTSEVSTSAIELVHDLGTRTRTGKSQRRIALFCEPCTAHGGNDMAQPTRQESGANVHEKAAKEG